MHPYQRSPTSFPIRSGLASFLDLVSLWCWHNEGKKALLHSFPVTPLLVSHPTSAVVTPSNPPLPPAPLSTADKQGAFCGCRGQKLRLGKYAVKLKCHLTQWGPFVNLFSRTVGAGHENYFVRTPKFFTCTLVRHGTLRLSSNPSQPYWFVNFHLFMYFFYYNLCNIYLPHVRPGVKFQLNPIIIMP